MGTAVRPARPPGAWDALADVGAFGDEVLAELGAVTNSAHEAARHQGAGRAIPTDSLLPVLDRRYRIDRRQIGDSREAGG